MGSATQEYVMRWKDRRESENVEDRRGMSPKMVGGGLGVLVVALLVMFLGGNPGDVVEQMGQQPGPSTGAPRQTSPEEDELARMVAVVLADTEDVWNVLFKETGKTYREPKLVLFSGQVKSACGFASAAVGPFYCPGDQTVYIDLSFYETLRRRFGAKGDFAQAYVIAHEIGHHVQQLMGVMEHVNSRRGRMSKTEMNALTVRLELQADFFAGVWAHHAQRMKNMMERGDLEEAILAAESIGDDAIQMKTQGHVVPDAFTHGTSAQRMAWFRHGYDTGDISQGNTFDDAHFRRINPR